MTYPGAWQPHTFTLPSLCCFFIPLQAAFRQQGPLAAAVSSLSWECAGSIGCEEVSFPALSTLNLKYRKIKNWLSQVQDKDGLGSHPNLKLVHGWFACPANGKKSELPLNSLGKTHSQLCLRVWSFKVLWQHVGVLHSLLDFISVLYCGGWSQVLICPDPMWTEGLWSYLVCETQSSGWAPLTLFPPGPWFLSCVLQKWSANSTSFRGKGYGPKMILK